MKKFFSFLFVTLLPVVASAYYPVDDITIPGYDAKIDSIYYKFISEDEAWVSYELYRYVSYYNQNWEYSESTYYLSDYSGDIVIPESVTYNNKTYRVTGINDGAFYNYLNHVKITSVTIPNSIKRIGAKAFWDCATLGHVYCLAEDVPATESDAFYYYNAYYDYTVIPATFHVPAASLELYKTTSPWSNFRSIVPLEVEINETNFPDENFRSWVLNESFGSDGVLSDEEIAEIKEICLVNNTDLVTSGQCGPIASLKGIECFTELTKLKCVGLMLSELDLRSNTKLTELECYENELLTYINVSHTTTLNILDCHNNPKLEEVSVAGCKGLTSVDLSGCSALTTLDCIYMRVNKFDVSGCSSLTALDCSSAKMDELKVSGCAAMTTLLCNNNNLAELDLTGCFAMQELDCSNNQLTSLEVSDCSGLIKLQYWRNKIKAPEMEALIESLPVTSTGRLYAVYNERVYKDQNVMTTLQVAAAQAKGWIVRYYNIKITEDYLGSEPTEVVSFTAGQMATIILPKAPKAEKGWYYRLDRCENGQIIFEEELQPQAHTPYIIVPKEDFCIDLGTLHLEGLSNDAVSIEGISFIGSYTSEELTEKEGWHIEIIDTTPDCLIAELGTEKSVIGALRAYLQVPWDEPYNPGGTKGPKEKMEIVLKDNPNGIETTRNPETKVQSDRSVFDLQGRKVTTDDSSLKKGVYIKGGKKMLKR